MDVASDGGPEHDGSLDEQGADAEPPGVSVGVIERPSLDAGAEEDASTVDASSELPVCDDQFDITITCLSGPCAQPVYVHTCSVTWHGFSFEGSAFAYEGSVRSDEAIVGRVVDGELSYRAVHTGAVRYVHEGAGTVAADYTASGMATGNDPRGASQTFSFTISEMNVGCTRDR